MCYKRSTIVLILYLTTICFILSCNNKEKKMPNFSNNTETAKNLYLQNCVSCHGKTGSLSINNATKLPESTLPRTKVIQTIKNGSPGKMQAFGNRFTDEQIAALADYVISLRPKK